jgi:hypothetical protein
MRVLLAAEDEGHRVAVMTLTDRLIAERVEWAAELPEYVRTWCSDAGQPYLALKTAYERARADRLPIYGHFGSTAGEADAAMWRAVFFLAQSRDDEVSHVVAARDEDGDERRLQGLKQAIEERSWPFVVVCAVARPAVESWFFAAYDPRDEREARRLAQLSARLGVDPRSEGRRLTRHTARDPKRAARELELPIGEDGAERFREALWRTLHERGEDIGLRAFLEAMDEQVRASFPGRHDALW